MIHDVSETPHPASFQSCVHYRIVILRLVLNQAINQSHQLQQGLSPLNADSFARSRNFKNFCVV
jgi:hypothetical protein